MRPRYFTPAPGQRRPSRARARRKSPRAAHQTARPDTSRGTVTFARARLVRIAKLTFEKGLDGKALVLEMLTVSDRLRGYSLDNNSSLISTKEPATVDDEISVEAEGGTFVVPVTINGALILKFTIDSGASDVSIPADVVSTLIRTGTINSGDFLGRATYTLADGSALPSERFERRFPPMSSVATWAGNHWFHSVEISLTFLACSSRRASVSYASSRTAYAGRE